ncbi:MAG: glycogen phosphorylase, partial [Clostridiales bacterium]|nr:glycogen phosphorylase [Clostridiales bacterium]
MTRKIDKEEFKKEVIDYLKVLSFRTIEDANQQQLFQAVSYALKDYVMDQWIATHKAKADADAKIVYYLSMEFLMGRTLGNMILNLSGNQEIKEGLEELGIDLCTL